MFAAFREYHHNIYICLPEHLSYLHLTKRRQPNVISCKFMTKMTTVVDAVRSDRNSSSNISTFRITEDTINLHQTHTNTQPNTCTVHYLVGPIIAP